MSRAFVRASTSPQCGRFEVLLPKVDEAKPELKLVRGRTGEMLEKLREASVAEGRETGYHEGFAEGREEAFEATRMAMEASIVAFRLALDERASRVEGAVADWYEAAEENLASLGVAIAAHILGREIKLSEDSVTDIAREALRAVSAVDKVRIRINPFDADVLKKKLAEILASGPTVRGVEIVDDATIEAGIKIESDAGLIDATIRTQIELAYESLRRQS